MHGLAAGEEVIGLGTYRIKAPMRKPVRVLSQSHGIWQCICGLDA